MNYEQFFTRVKEDKIELKFDNLTISPPARLSNEALFHLPLLALTILVLAKGRRKPRVNHLGQLVGECFERTFAGFKGSSQHVGWSANLRVRTVRALTFLEAASLVEVSGDLVIATEAGREVVNTLFKNEESDLNFTVRTLERAYRDIGAERQLSLGLG